MLGREEEHFDQGYTESRNIKYYPVSEGEYSDQESNPTYRDPHFFQQEDVPEFAEQKEKTPDTNPEKEAFEDLIAHSNDVTHLMDLLSTSDYKPSRLMIFRAVNLLDENTSNAENSSAVIFAREHAEVVAKTLNILRSTKIDFRVIANQDVRTLAYLNIIKAGKDAEKMAMAIKRYNDKCHDMLQKFSVLDAYRIIDLFLKLKKADVGLTDNLCAFVMGSDKHNRTFLIQALIDLRSAEIPNQYFQTLIVLHDQYQNAGPIALLLGYLKRNGIAITDEMLEAVIIEARQVDEVIIEIHRLKNHGIKPSPSIITSYYRAASLIKVTNFLIELKNNNMLPKALQTELAEIKESTLSEKSVMNILNSKDPNLICRLMVLRRDSIDIQDDFFVECLLLCPDEILNLTNIFSDLRRETIPFDENTKSIIYQAIQWGVKKEIIDDLIEEHQKKYVTYIKNNQQSLLPTLPSELINCVISFFHPPKMELQKLTDKEPNEITKKQETTKKII